MDIYLHMLQKLAQHMIQDTVIEWQMILDIVKQKNVYVFASANELYSCNDAAKGYVTNSYMN